MKFTKIFPAVILSVFSPLAIAATALGQAGDIAVGAPYYLSKGEMASYFKEGKEGYVTFQCSLEGEGNIVASLYGGKNLAANTPRKLSNGSNGPFTWKFRNLGEENGNIKIKLLVGSFAKVQCQELSYGDDGDEE